MEEFINALASSLGELRRSPGNNTAWVDATLKGLERKRPADHERLRRNLGFGRRLAELAGIGEADTATLTLGLFFDGVIGEGPSDPGAKVPQAWSEYLLRNEHWLAPSLNIALGARLAGWEGSGDSVTAVLAKASVIFDTETLIYQTRPLEVLQSMRDQATTPAIERTAEILWSEEGQQLCDHHIRQREKGYQLEPKDIQNSLKLLSREAPRAAAPRPAAPEQVATPLRRKPDESRREGLAAATSENFERHKRALRTGTDAADVFRSNPDSAEEISAGIARSEASPQEQPVGLPREEALPIAAVAAQAEQAEASAAHAEAQPEHPDRLIMRSVGSAAGASAGEPEPAEDQTPVNAPPSWRGAGRQLPSGPLELAGGQSPEELSAQLSELKARLDQIEQLVSESQQLVATLAPALGDVSSMLGDFDTLIRRWKS